MKMITILKTSKWFIPLTFSFGIMMVSMGCEEDNFSHADQLIGSWQFAYYQTAENGRIDYPNDGKPVYWDIKTDSTYEGMAGNNEIFGEYKTSGDTIFFTLFGSEIIGTEWENRFYKAINYSWNGKAFAMPYELKGNELILKYYKNDTMHFMQID